MTAPGTGAPSGREAAVGGGRAEPAAIAPLRYRLGAMLYDALIVIAMWVFTIVALVTLTGAAVTGAWVQSVLFLELYAFFAFSWMHRGQTVGMLAWRLELRSDAPFTPSRALRRFLGACLAFASLGIGYAWIWFDRERRTWPDRFSGSTVVRRPKR